MGLIERAAERLEELRRAGIDIPSPAPAPMPPAAEAPAAPAPAAAVPPSRPQGSPLHIDLARLAARGYVTPTMPRSRIADEFRILKRPLLANATRHSRPPSNLVMVTSAAPGEGKTFTATNLAMSIAMELDRTVLLVDADVARPSLPHTLGLRSVPGLMDVLQENASADEVVHPTNVPKLSFLAAGTAHPRAAELLASDAMGSLVRELATRHPERIVVFDSPPLLVTTEARVLATRMGQIVFVVHAETTLQGHVVQALATIDSCPIRLIVLNGATTSQQGAYGYGYGYAHRSDE